jgi:anti-sigma factor RsiW
VADRRCQRVFAALSNYLDGALPVRSCRELEKHLQACKPCLAYLESLKATIRACREFQVSKVPRPSLRVRAALLQSIRKR